MKDCFVDPTLTFQWHDMAHVPLLIFSLECKGVNGSQKESRGTNFRVKPWKSLWKSGKEIQWKGHFFTLCMAVVTHILEVGLPSYISQIGDQRPAIWYMVPSTPMKQITGLHPGSWPSALAQFESTVWRFTSKRAGDQLSFRITTTVDLSVTFHKSPHQFQKLELFTEQKCRGVFSFVDKLPACSAVGPDIFPRTHGDGNGAGGGQEICQYSECNTRVSLKLVRTHSFITLCKISWLHYASN